MEERRIHRRKTLPLDVPLYNTVNDELVGHIVDLSHNGIRISTEESFAEGTELELKMALPDRWAFVNEIDFTAQCCWWENKSEAEEAYTAGFRIIDITDTESFVIQEILSLYGNPT